MNPPVSGAAASTQEKSTEGGEGEQGGRWLRDEGVADAAESDEGTGIDGRGYAEGNGEISVSIQGDRVIRGECDTEGSVSLPLLQGHSSGECAQGKITIL